jgi:hypothetical protein
MLKSNITIAPNIYVRSVVELQGDEDFIQSVYGYRALNLLKARFPKSYASRFTRAQIEEMKQNVVCRHAKSREHAYGKALVDGVAAWSCRCEYSVCHNFEKCMELPNAMRIDRVALAQELQELEGSAEFEGEQTHGFDHEECSFEPPHVGVILPILNDILNSNDTEHEEPGVPAQEPQAPPEEAADATSSMLDAFAEIIPEFQWVAEKFGLEGYEIDPDKRTLVICEDSQEAGYFSTVLYKNKVKHRILRSEGYTLNRRIADVFWDYCSDEIEKEAFLMRCSVRTDSSDAEALEFYNALFELCGDESVGDEGGLRANRMAESLNESPELISECVLNMEDPDCSVTISTIDSLSPDDEYDDVMILEGENIITMFMAVEDLFGSAPEIIHKDSHSGWVFSKSALGRPCRISLNNYTGGPGQNCLNVELGLWGDVDGKSFLTEQMGDAIRLQLYIAEKIKEGDELTVSKNPANGGWWFYHNGNTLGEFPEAIMREVKAIEGFPDDFVGFEGIYVRNIVTCVSERDDSLPARFRDSRIWLGLDITGYAKVLI